MTAEAGRGPGAGPAGAGAAAPDPLEGRLLYGGDPAAYAAGRPDYPDRVYELLVACGLGPGCRVVEIGPGTGLVTGHLLGAGAQVTAVEANPEMAAYLQQACAGPRLEVVVAPFEEAALPEAGFDLAVAATSFHWVSRPRGWDELRRVLRPRGWVAIWWMLFEDPTAPDEFSAASHRVLGGSPSVALESDRRPFQIDVPARRADLEAAGFVEVHGELIRSTACLDAARLRALYATMAIVLRRPADEQAQVLGELERLVEERFDGWVERPFLTGAYLGRKP